MPHLDMQRADLPPEHVDQLAQVALELVDRVRDDSPEANARWLNAQLPDPADQFRLLFVLAAAVPTDRPWAHLTAWARHRANNGQENPA